MTQKATDVTPDPVEDDGATVGRQGTDADPTAVLVGLVTELNARLASIDLRLERIEEGQEEAADLLDEVVRMMEVMGFEGGESGGQE